MSNLLPVWLTGIWDSLDRRWLPSLPQYSLFEWKREKKSSVFLLTAQVIVSPRLLLRLTVLMPNLGQGGGRCRWDPALFPFILSACLNSAKVFVLSAHEFGFGAQKLSVELCRDQIKVQKLKAFVVKFLSGSDSAPSICFHSLLWYLLYALSDLSNMLCKWLQFDLRWGAPCFFLNIWFYFTVCVASSPPDNIQVVHRPECNETARIPLPATCAIAQLTILCSEQFGCCSVQRSRHISPAASLRHEDVGAAGREGQAPPVPTSVHDTQMLYSLQGGVPTLPVLWHRSSCPTPTYPFRDRRRATAVSFVRSPDVHSGDHLFWAAFAAETVVLGWLADWLSLVGFKQYTTHSVLLICLWIYAFILIILLFWRMAEHRGKCYIPDSCPCTWKDREFLSGEMIATPCYTWWVTCILHISKSPVSSHKVKLIQRMCWVHGKSKIYMFVYRQLQDISFIKLTNRLGRTGRLLGECFFGSERKQKISELKSSQEQVLDSIHIS